MRHVAHSDDDAINRKDWSPSPGARNTWYSFTKLVNKPQNKGTHNANYEAGEKNPYRCTNSAESH
jgi:hypothetical protein